MEATDTVVSARLDSEARAGIRETIGALEQIVALARGRLRDRVAESGRTARTPTRVIGVTATAPSLSGEALARHALGLYAFATIAAELEACRALRSWAARAGRAFEAHLADAYVATIARSLRGGVALGGSESVGLDAIAVEDHEAAALLGARSLLAWTSRAGSAAALCGLAAGAPDGGFGDLHAGGADAEIVAVLRDRIRRVAAEALAPAVGGAREPSRIAALVARERALAPPDPERPGSGQLARVVAIEELARAGLACAAPVALVAPHAVRDPARLDEAACGVGLAQAVLEIVRRAARERGDLTRAPRGAHRFGWIAARTMAARQLTYAAATAQDAASRGVVVLAAAARFLSMGVAGEAAALAGEIARTSRVFAAEARRVQADVDRLRAACESDDPAALLARELLADPT